MRARPDACAGMHWLVMTGKKNQPRATEITENDELSNFQVLCVLCVSAPLCWAVFLIQLRGTMSARV